MPEKPGKRRGLAIAYRILFPERRESYHEAEAEKISYGGMLVRTVEKLAIGSLLEIEISMGRKGKDKLKLLGEVKWTRPVENERSYSTGVFYLLPTAGRMYRLFMAENRRALEDIKSSKTQ